MAYKSEGAMTKVRAQGIWFVLMGDQRLPIESRQWVPYHPEPCFLLTQAWSTSMLGARGSAPEPVLLLDLSVFTNPPAPYFVYRGFPYVVSNPNAPAHLRGKHVVAGYLVDLWDAPKASKDMQHESMKMANLVGYFYQVHIESLEDLVLLDAYYKDETGTANMPKNTPRRRVVMLAELPSVADGARRFARRKEPCQVAPQVPAESVTVLDDDGKGCSAVYEWWYGPAPNEAEMPNPPVGRWKPYHPHVCRRLEGLFQRVPEFKDGTTAVDVDGVRYMLRHITKDKPFDYTGAASVEPFQSAGVITIQNPCFNEIDRATENCFVQFQKGNPYRRRPARRRPDATEIARSAVMTGKPCDICLSDDGQLAGCNVGHVICKSCLRAGLRCIAGDTLAQTGLLCGCFDRKTRRALLVLAERADVSLQHSLADPPADKFEREDLEKEVSQLRFQFGINQEDSVPDNLFAEKITEWFRKVWVADVSHLYHACSDPACADKIENWILIDDFDKEYARQGQTVWLCREGHRNSVLPSEEDIDNINRSLLAHPEYYVGEASYDRCPLRRYRLCGECCRGGVLMLAAHNEGCKQWPGSGSGHNHCFCFSCCAPWGEGAGKCNHGNNCTDPGIQQVRLNGELVEIGFVHGAQYIDWVNGNSESPPPTVFHGGPDELGKIRQERLSMTDRLALRSEFESTR